MCYLELANQQMILLALKGIEAKTEARTLGNKCAALGLFSIIIAWIFLSAGKCDENVELITQPNRYFFLSFFWGTNKSPWWRLVMAKKNGEGIIIAYAKKM